MLPRIITNLVGWAVALFYDVERTGPPLAEGPVLVTANHPNALVDPLVIFRTGGRPTRPLAKAPLFEQTMVGLVLKGLGGLPVYRRQDDPSLMHQNAQTFDAAIEALRRGEAVQIYPEGQSHSGPSMTPLRSGAARIALQTESQGAWAVGLRVQPVGLTYTRKHLFRGRVVAAFGEPISVAGYRETFESDERDAVRALTGAIRDGLEAVTLSYEREEDRALVDVAERLYAREKGLARPRERASMAERLPRLQGFAAGLRWLRVEDPDRLKRLQERVSRYLRLVTLFGATEGDVPRTYRTASVLRYVARQLFMLVAVLPVAVVGFVLWLVPSRFTRWAAFRYRPKLDQIATYKLAMGVMVFPTWWLAGVIAAFLTAGRLAGVAAAVLLPLTGVAAIAWRDRRAVVREDLRVFLRARRRSQARDRLAELRASLVREFDALQALRVEDDET